tara:strand:- start:471 stop:2180 length:1710 start_codon:yes stop_codon:yes gene_type:complete
MIKFNRVKFKNFGSFGNYYTEIDFSENSMTLVSGSNGHGKSYALLDSITFALFGKPFRKINISQLVNSINNKDCLVVVEFEIGKDSYRVVRGLKPKKFEIYKNDELIKQSAKSKDYQNILEEQILKINYKSFTQIVTLGSSSFIPFMQLTPVDRRSVIEDILDISIFSSMNFIIKAKSSSLKERVSSKQKDIQIVDEKIKIQISNLESLTKNKMDALSDNNKKIEKIKNQVKELKNKLNSLTSSYDSISVNDNYEMLNESLSKHSSLINQFNDKIKINKTELEFYGQNEACPTCNQSIDEEFKNKRRESLIKKQSEFFDAIEKLDSQKEDLIKKINECKENTKQKQEIQLEINETKNSMTVAIGYMENLSNESTESNLDESIEDIKEKLNQYEIEKNKLTEELETIKERKSNYQILSLLLKDSGIKAKIIKNYLPIMNDMINNYLREMNFFVSFSLDEEFNEEIKSRHRDNFSYMNFSEGEKSRIDLAILLAWREIAKVKNSSYCNLLILDEVFDSSLDSLGVDDLFSILNHLSEKNNVFVITHKSDQLIDKFKKHISFKKKNNFSRIV